MDIRNKNPVLNALLQFLEEPKKCDVKFNVHLGGDAWMPFWGHRLILSIWSPVFAARFSEKKNEESREIDIQGYPPTVFQHFLRFMYNSSEGIYENKNNGKFLLDLYKLAELYQVEQLKKECSKFLIASTVDAASVFQLLEAANYIGLESVKLRCFEFLKDKTAEVIAEQNLRKITSSMLFTVLKLDTLSLHSEYDLLSWVLDWAESECNRLPETEPQEIIEPFLPYLNFASLKAEQFGALVNNHKKFFDDSDGFRIFLNICDPGPNCMSLPTWHNEAKNFRSYKIINSENLSALSSENFLSNNTQRNNTTIELNRGIDKKADDPFEDLKSLNDNRPTKFGSPSMEESNTKDDASADNIKDTDVESSIKNTKPKEYLSDLINFMKSSEISSRAEQVAVSLLESSSPVPEDESENEFNQYQSLDNYSLDKAFDGSRLRRKIKKKKIKRRYLLSNGKSEPHAKSMDLVEGTYSSGDFQSLIGMVWKQHRLTAEV